MTRLAVVGDALLDRDLSGSVGRLSPEAPVPVVDEEVTTDRPGGAGLAALLGARHGADVTLVTAIAVDAGGRRLHDLLASAGVELEPVHDTGSTLEKIRVRVDGRTLLRIDRGAQATLGALPRRAAQSIAAADVVAVCDYGRQVAIHPEVRAALAGRIDRGLPVVWDPHPRGRAPLPGSTLATPNRAEADHFAGERGDVAPATSLLRFNGVATRAHELLSRWQVEAIAVTLSGDGALLVTGNGPPLVVPVAAPVAGGDTCGAGDAFSVAAALAIATGASAGEAVAAAVASASEFVAAGGAAGLVSPVAAPASSVGRVEQVRRTGGTVVATGGCFDLLHAGHVATLEHARRLGDALVVLLNSDASVRRLKGPGRPAQRAEDRAAVLRALGCVDDVIVFAEDTPVEALRRLRPHVFVKGGDYTGQVLPEAAAMAEWGGVVVTVPYLDGRSTTRIIDRLATPQHRQRPLREVASDVV